MLKFTANSLQAEYSDEIYCGKCCEGRAESGYFAPNSG